jgi:hypothetical protein
MTQALFRVEECSFKSIFGTFEGHRIYASRKVAEKIEIQTRYAAELYNVDVRQDQRYLAEKDLFPCGDRDESRFSPDFQVPLSILGMEVPGDPNGQGIYQAQGQTLCRISRDVLRRDLFSDFNTTPLEELSQGLFDHQALSMHAALGLYCINLQDFGHWFG